VRNAPALPSPVKKRNTLNTPREPVKPLKSDARPKIAMLASNSGLRPKRSPIGLLIIFRGQSQHCVSESYFCESAQRQASFGIASVNVSN
jgi:hypothetical protein